MTEEKLRLQREKLFSFAIFFEPTFYLILIGGNVLR